MATFSPAPGDRVRFNAKGIDVFSDIDKVVAMRGVVTFLRRFDHGSAMVDVLWDGSKSVEGWRAEYLEPAKDEPIDLDFRGRLGRKRPGSSDGRALP